MKTKYLVPKPDTGSILCIETRKEKCIVIPSDRKQQILEILDNRGYASVEELSRLMYVSLPTVRRDLSALEKEGVLLRTHGGASYIRPDYVVSPIVQRREELRSEKKSIGKLAAALVENNDTLFISIGSTCFWFVHEIPADYYLQVLTNGPTIARYLAQNRNMTTVCPGGTYNFYHDGIYGPEAADFISRHHAHRCFFSCDGVDLQGGVTVNPDLDVQIDRAFRRHSDTMILLADHTKFGKNFFYQTLTLPELDIIVTDRSPGEEWERHCSENGIRLIYEKSDSDS